MQNQSKNHSVINRAIRHIDHITYVDHYSHEKDFIHRWEVMGFHEHVRVHTERYPASHIALTSGSNPDFPWETMTGLSVTKDPKSPINEFVKRYGPGLQHPAYNVDPVADMEELQKELVASGWVFMTPVLTYEDSNGAKMKQMFVAPTLPYGPFVEFAQRFENAKREPFDGFDVRNIDDLYEEYIQYSKHLDSKHHRRSA